MTPESNLVGRIRKAIKRRWPSAYVEKIHGDPYQSAGVPDLIVIVDGRFVGLEVKAPRPRESDEHARERATPHQRDNIRRIRRAGGVAGVVINVAEALALIESALPEGGRSDGDHRTDRQGQEEQEAEGPGPGSG